MWFFVQLCSSWQDFNWLKGSRGLSAAAELLVLFMYILFRELTYRSDASTDFRAWWLKRRGLTQGCAFWVSLILLPIYVIKNPNFGGVNRRFQAKLAKSENMHIIKTTASIPTKFCTLIKTTKCPSWVVRSHNKSKMADGRHLGKIEKSPHLAAVWPISTKFGQWRSSTISSRPAVKISKI